MGQVDYVWKRYFKDKRRFADFFNGVCWGGQKVISEEGLEDASEVAVFSGGGTKSGKAKLTANTRDIKMRMRDSGFFRLLAIENQNLVDYTMPFRNMWYDVVDYRNQLLEKQRDNQAANDYATGAERMCRMKKTDRLMPVFTICFYHGEEAWDGPRSLRDMMHSEALREPFGQLFSDYPFHLYCLNEEMDTDVFTTEIGPLFELLKYRQNQEALRNLLETKDAYRHLDKETLEVASVVMDMPEIWEYRDEYRESMEEYDMCKAIRGLMADSKAEGRQEGRQEGRREGRQLECETHIRNLMETLQLSVEQAMNALLIPEEERDKYRTLV